MTSVASRPYGFYATGSSVAAEMDVTTPQSDALLYASTPSLPALLCASDIADELGISPQRVYQLRKTAAFPEPIAELRSGAIWDAAAVRAFAEQWNRRPGRPRTRVVRTGPRKRGPKPSLWKTVAMYYDYCTGLSLDEVAAKWGYSSTVRIRFRFKTAKLPLRQPPAHDHKYRGPGALAGIDLADANRERTHRAALQTTKRAKAAINNAPNDYCRGILQLRIDHPRATLAELAALHQPPITKDAVASVIRRAKGWTR